MGVINVKNKTYLLNGVAMDSDRQSAAQLCDSIQHCTVYIWWTGGSTPVGEIQLWGRVNPEDERTAIYKQLTLSSTLSVSGASGSLTLNITEPLGEWYIKYDRTSGDGTLYATWEGRSKG